MKNRIDSAAHDRSLLLRLPLRLQVDSIHFVNVTLETAHNKTQCYSVAVDLSPLIACGSHLSGAGEGPRCCGDTCHLLLHIQLFHAHASAYECTFQPTLWLELGLIFKWHMAIAWWLGSGISDYRDLDVDQSCRCAVV